ncbi:Acyl-CoA N-acyltransferase [Penicillium roqueforti FM164]|uniref:Acyl-CoA N-acyltransferase n=1 Tax=Penicillium roqueforti (strain FM164) TaxID=1365484 RepID=W6QCF1_PENRF|nr:Acyl-CoA N-acyltransferase [Penicillium roqueforti FM164]
MCEDYANNTYPQAPTKVVGVSTYSRVIIEGKLVGHAFGCRWTCKGGTVCWITQLVVDRHHRGKGFATSLLRILRTDHDTIYGVMSSHPAACLAAVKAFDRTIEKVDLDFIAKNANETMSTSPVPYIRDAELCGIIFDGKDTTGIVSGVNTKFFVDHKEPLKALAVVEKKWDWPLGKLPEGYEYLLILPASAS